MSTLAVAVLLTLSAGPGIQTAAARSLAYTAPAAWHTRPTSSSMRVAEFVITHVTGDAEDGELIVYYFGTSAGTVDANVNRWISQIQQPDGSPTQDKARRATRTVNGLTVTTVDAAGTYVAGMRPGAAEHFNKPGFRLRAAVVETPRGAYYIKMTGPAATIDAADNAFDAFIGSIRYVP